jgi:hypothetical protein
MVGQWRRAPFPSRTILIGASQSLHKSKICTYAQLGELWICACKRICDANLEIVVLYDVTIVPLHINVHICTEKALYVGTVAEIALRIGGFVVHCTDTSLSAILNGSW